MIEFKQEMLSYSDNPGKIIKDYIGSIIEQGGKALASENGALLKGETNSAIAHAGRVSGFDASLKTLEAILQKEGIVDATPERDR